MSLWLQVIGGAGSLLHKVFSRSGEHAAHQGRSEAARMWRIWAWIAYIVGQPAWLVIYVSERNWIAASLAIAGLPAMTLGLLNAWKHAQKKSRWLQPAALIAVAIGIIISLWDFRGLSDIRQWLEMGLASGFLIGNYQVARGKQSGFLWYVLMHVSAGILLGVQGYTALAALQCVSLFFVADAYRFAAKTRNE